MIFGSFLLTTLSATLFYLASPHQRLRMITPATFGKHRLMVLAVGTSALALWSACSVLSGWAGVFFWMTGLMTVWVVLPYLAAIGSSDDR